MVDIRKEWRLPLVNVTFSWRDPGGWGRFGGGWNWKVGVQWGGATVLFSLLVCELKFARRKKGG